MRHISDLFRADEDDEDDSMLGPGVTLWTPILVLLIALVFVIAIATAH